MKTRYYRFAQAGMTAGTDADLTVPECVGPGYLRFVAQEDVGSTLVAGDRVNVQVGEDPAIYPHDVTADVYDGANPAGRMVLDRFVPKGTLVTVHVQRDATVATRDAVFTVCFDHGDNAEADMLASLGKGPQSAAVAMLRSILGR